REGRAEEWKAFSWSVDPPDPAAEETIEKCVLRKGERETGIYAQAMTDYYRQLIAFSKRLRGQRPEVSYDDKRKIITLDYPAARLRAVFSFSSSEYALQPENGLWTCIMSSAFFSGDADSKPPFASDKEFTIPPWSALILER